MFTETYRQDHIINLSSLGGMSHEKMLIWITWDMLEGRVQLPLLQYLRDELRNEQEQQYGHHHFRKMTSQQFREISNERHCDLYS